jgi:acetate---CoA ligase (ADP-forming)
VSGLDCLFAPHSIAVLGVSRNPAKLGFRLLQNIKDGGYAGRLYPVNPSRESILGLGSIASPEELPSGIDLALVSLPASAVPEAITALAARQVRAAVVLSSGFGEVDEHGSDVQDRMHAAARHAGLRLVGPNCMGVYSAPARLNGTYFWDLPRVDGGVAVVSQSGAYGGLIFRHLGARGLGVSRFVSIGNQADVDVADLLDYLTDDPATRLIACFVEALRDGRRFVDVAGRAARAKPVVVLKGGRSDAGRRAAGSHTGSLAGSYEAYRAACDRAGVVLADETEEFFDAIEALATAGGVRPAAASVAIVTVSGGPSVIAADAAERAGLVVPALDEMVRRDLRQLLPSFAAVGNPVDLTPQVEPARIAPAIRSVLDDASVAGAIAVNVGLDIPEFADAVVSASEATAKPVVAFTADAPSITSRFRERGVPVLASPERAVRAWRALWTARPRRAPEGLEPLALSADVAAELETSSGALPYRLARRLLESAGVQFCAEDVALTAESAAAAAAALGYPVVVKADAPGLLHRTDVGGVKLDVPDRAALLDACHDLRARIGATAFVVQKRLPPGPEILIGGRRDETFGPVVLAGVGGVLTEALREVSMRLSPVDAEEARAMLAEGAVGRLLASPRGPERDGLARAIVGVARLLDAAPRIVEIDVNPMIVWAGSAFAVDAVVILDDGVTASRFAKES